MNDFDRIFEELEKESVRYLVVGGVAVVLHGHPRFTANLDLILDLESSNVRAALKALKRLGYQPRAPVPFDEFSDPIRRKAWVEEKSLSVFALWSPELPATEVDLFVEEPLPFEEAFRRAIRANLSGLQVRVASLEDLVSLKRRAGRPKDLEDIVALQALAKERRRE